MKAKEFRIGNLTLAKSPEKTEWIEGHPVDIYNLYYLLYPKSAGAIPIDMKPIPLTEEWLIKFGFLNDGVTFKISTSRIRLILFKINSANEYNNNCNEFTATVYQSKQSIEICRVKHVHQLQNLYFALTGKELTIHKAI